MYEKGIKKYQNKPMETTTHTPRINESKPKGALAATAIADNRVEDGSGFGSGDVSVMAATRAAVIS